MSRATAFQFLCGCLSRNEPEEALLRSARSPSFAWETFVQVATEMLVAPAVHYALCDRNIDKTLPAPVVSFFDGMAFLNRQRNKQLVSEAIALAATLNEIEVVPVFLKGSAHLLCGLYPDPAQRIISDLDVLVPAARLSDCVTRLSADGLKELVTDSDFSEHHHHPPLRRPDRIAAVELHSEPLYLAYTHLLPAAEVLSQAVILAREAVKFAVPPAYCRVVQGVAHAELADQAYFYGLLPLRELVDFARLHQTYAHEVNWSDLVQRFAGCGCLTALEYHVVAAARLLAVPIEQPIRVSRIARALYRRALWQVEHPQWTRRSTRLLLFRRSLSERTLRRRLMRNLGDLTWYQRQWRTLRK